MSGAAAVYGVPTMFIAMQSHPTSSAQPGPAAYRDHGRLVCPVEVMALVNEMRMAEASICLRHDRDHPGSRQTRVDDDLERRTATIGRVRPHVEIKIVDPATGATVERGQAG